MTDGSFELAAPLSDWLVTLVGPVTLHLRAHAYSAHGGSHHFEALLEDSPPSTQSLISIPSPVIRHIQGGWPMSESELAYAEWTEPTPGNSKARDVVCRLLAGSHFAGAAELAQQAPTVVPGVRNRWFCELLTPRDCPPSSFDEGVAPARAFIGSLSEPIGDVRISVHRGYLDGVVIDWFSRAPDGPPRFPSATDLHIVGCCSVR